MEMFGIVKWFSSKAQSFGFITRDDGPDVFVHYRGLAEEGQADPKYKMLVPGQRVSFELAPGHYCAGTQAVNVKVVANGHSPKCDTTSGETG